MNQHLQAILDIIQQSQHLTADEKATLLKSAKTAAKELEITEFKLDRTEKVKRTTAILLEETIEELEQKRRAVEQKNYELEIENALEKVRAIALSMKEPADMPEVCKIIATELDKLGVKEIRNVQTAIFYESKGTYMNYEYYAKHDKTFITETSYTNSEMHTAFAAQMMKGAGESFATYMNGDEVKDWIAHQKTTNVFIDNFLDTASSLNYYWHSLGAVALGISTYEPLKEEDKNLFRRFVKVFELAYRRYLDIENAEAQAKEAKIEAALERVRSRSMAMHKSEELAELSFELVKQVQALGVPTWFCAFNIYDDDEKGSLEWGSNAETTYPRYRTPRERIFLRYYEAGQSGETFLINEIGENECPAHYDYLCSLPGIGDQLRKMRDSGVSFPAFQIDHVAFFKYGYIIFITYEPAPESHDIFQRFAKVFEQTYTRFLDLQKAEAQAREAQVEASMEKVRSRSIGMQKSEELKEVIKVVYEQFVYLSIHVEHAGFIMDYKERDDMHIWLADKHKVPSEITFPYFDSPHWNSFIEAKEKGMNFFANHLSFEEKNKFYQGLFKLFPVPDEAKEYYFNCAGLAISTVLLDNVGLYIENFSGTPYSQDENNTLMRFGKVFQQTYTRFLDLAKAEAQARESQIQLALERVRARTMAMYQSTELAETSSVLFQQIKDLGFETWSCGFCIWSKDDLVKVWMGADSGGLLPPMLIPYKTEPTHHEIYKASLRGDAAHENVWEGEALEEHYEYLRSVPSVAIAIEVLEKSGLSLPSRQCYYVGFFKQGYLLLITKEPNAEMHGLSQRFASVFEQTYTRFLDLQKAEAQSRESQIELSLERVRAKTMAMHNSADVGETAAVMVEELKKLDVETIRCGIGIMHEPGDMEVWTITTDEKNKTDIIIGWLDMNMHPLLHGAFESWRKKNESYSYELKDDDLLNYYNSINNYPGYPIHYDTSSLPGHIHHNEFYFPEGILFAFSLEQLSAEQKKIFKRFAGVFGQTYRRYLDLKTAEAQGRESQIEASLERVRSRTLAMQKSGELAETSAVLFRQLISLGIEPNRLYISIMKDDEGETEFWITDEDGSKVSAAYTDNLNDNPSFKKMYEGWKAGKQSMIIDMKGEELQEYFAHLNSLNVPFKDGLKQKRRIQHIAFFNRGFIGMAAPDDQPAETVHLLERFAAVFNLTFTRFNDLKLAEAHAIQAEEDLIKLQTEKKRAEDALGELKITQKQLIQSEKMASLGELTAGIAHEIQNPLNFVNNFSEVSKELLDEMKAALESGDEGEVKDIIKDVIQNLEKINHHGKRADAIVKGMLQHSRSSSTLKEVTDINALTDEYIRLCYHGLRAKDNAFNATIETNFDTTIEKINIIPQDIGRVILNVLTNAFYAVNEKKKTAGENYKPIVSVQTKKVNSKIEITVTDNGYGIPQNIIDKIFQPFFTTKPTGQGTGLGLSLSYDIIKAHGGGIQVDTKTGEGSEFIIELPLN